MPTIHVPEEATFEELLADRRRLGQDRYDEVWDGEDIIMPDPRFLHRVLAGRIYCLLDDIVVHEGRAIVQGSNVSDREFGWIENDIIPDLTMYRAEKVIENDDTHVVGGPSLAIEIVSPGDRTYEKVAKYDGFGTDELLLIDRDPFVISRYARSDEGLAAAGTAEPDAAAVTTEQVAAAWSLRTAGDGVEIVLEIDGEPHTHPLQTD